MFHSNLNFYDHILGVIEVMPITEKQTLDEALEDAITLGAEDVKSSGKHMFIARKLVII